MIGRFVLCACLVLSLTTGLAVDCLASQGAANGVIAQEFVVSLPQDEGQWFISVVGTPGDAKYARLLGWFDTSDNLRSLRDQTKYRQVDSSTAIYRERYAQNIKGLPTVRVQKPDGAVVYEAAGNAIPLTASGLYAAIAGSSLKAQGLRPILPWRREMERRCPDGCPSPSPEPGPEPLESEPPVLNGNGPPNFSEVEPEGIAIGWLIAAAIASVIAGVTAGVVVQWKQTYASA